ncbi:MULTISPECIES: DUF2254 domain-containing protein [Microvirga]|uniref:DUF2254 domain-containing protein n=1 Tax=Microvirga TaxID=186650 RepID=UPI0019201322|nr:MULTISPECIES: DUF2254 domain-containing protein [Microvirga]MBM6583591.1 DUF2254 domain-containing protein [Microvirga arvi]
MDRIRNTIVLLQGQLWLIPLLMSVSALVLAWWLLTSGATLLDGWNKDRLWWLFSGDASSARDLLSSLLSGLMTMTSLVVSVTFVILTLAANQLGPRLIATFMADRQIQSVLGLFLGTILYVLVVLRTLDEGLGTQGVPHIAVTAGSILTAICILALLFYVHKIARAIIADSVVARVAANLHKNIRSILPNEADGPERTVPDVVMGRSGAVALGRSGYIQVVDYKELVSVACRSNALLQVKVRAGHFVLQAGEHVIANSHHDLDKDTIDSIRSAFVVDTDRTPAQDLEYGLRQLVEIALRAVSPGINDPFTAVAVLDQLGAALEEIFQRSLQPVVWRDKGGVVRVIAQRSDAIGLTNAAFDAIRQASSQLPTVLIRMADVLGQLAPVLRSDPMREGVVGQLAKVAETAKVAHLTPSDREAVLIRVEQARAAISAAPKRPPLHCL